MSRPIIAFAHRGGMAHRPENTLDAFRNARRMGATAVETDAWLTRDGVVVLDHDGEIWMNGALVPIADVNRDQLPPHIPSLEEFYAACGPSMELSIDVRDVRAASEIVRIAGLAGAPAQAKLWLCHEELPVLQAWRGMSPDIHLVHSTDLLDIGAHLLTHLKKMSASGIEVLNLHERECNPLVLAACRATGVKLFGWNAHDQRRATRLVRMGVDGVYGNDINALQAAIEGPQQNLA